VADDVTTFTQDEVDEHVAGLKSALEKERQERREAKEELGTLRSSHADLQKRLQDLEHSKQAQDAGLDESKLEEIRSTIRADMERQYSDLSERAAQLEAELTARDGRIRELTLDNVVKASMGQAGVRADRIDALFRLTSDRYEIDRDEVIVSDARETPLPKYVATELSTEYPEFFEGSGSSGGGASRSAGGAGRNQKFIAAGDKKAFLDNVEAIAKGEVEVR
jgi:hypothetical protein